MCDLPDNIDDLLAFSEDDKRGDFRRFHLFSQYMEDEKGKKLHWEWKVTGTEEAIGGADVVNQKRHRETERFKAFIRTYLRENRKHLELRDLQLWMIEDKENDDA